MRTIKLSRAFTLLESGPVVLVTTHDGKRAVEGSPSSRQTLRSRIRTHYRGNAAGSTLRLSVGCLLEAQRGKVAWPASQKRLGVYPRSVNNRCPARAARQLDRGFR